MGKKGIEEAAEAKAEFIEDLMHHRPIAEATDVANEQHYEVRGCRCLYVGC